MRPNTLSIPLHRMPNVDFLEVAAGMKKMSHIRTNYMYMINSGFRKSVSVQSWLNEWVDEESKTLPTIPGKQDDKHALDCLEWVKARVHYLGDSSQWKMTEYWQKPSETLLSNAGDCEDGAILLYCIMRKNGFSDDQVFITAGNVVGGGHCYLVYVSKENAVHYVLDWCYWPKDSLRVKYGENPNYYFGDKE